MADNEIPDYVRGAVKQDPETLNTATRTGHPAADDNAWFVGNIKTGGHWAPYAEVADWVDVPGTPVPAGDAT